MAVQAPGELDPRRLERLVRGFGRLRLLVVGDVMLDEYLWGDVERVSPEAPVPVVHITRETQALGGAGNVVRNAVVMGADTFFCTAIGDDPAGDRIVDLLKDLGVASDGALRVEGRPTTRKTRVEARSQQMLRFDRETLTPLPQATVRRLLRIVEALLPRSQGVVLEDYGKGTLVPGLVRSIVKSCEAAGIPVVADPKQSFRPFRGADLVKPNRRELEALTGIRVREGGDLVRAVARLRRSLPGSDIVVTCGARGMTVFEGERAPTDVPIARSEVFDVQGAGDTSVVALALTRLMGGSLLEAAVVANAAAGVVVGKVGTATANPEEICALLPAAIAAARRGGSQ